MTTETDRTSVAEIVRRTLTDFCTEFVSHPYLCYTEHGQHARFFTQLHEALPPARRHTTWRGQRVGIVQKEYPTAATLGKPQRQHWDIAVLQDPAECLAGAHPAYDYLRLAAVVEFGLNAPEGHLVEDIRRLRHPDANVVRGFVAHLYRLSPPGAPFSGRDWSPRSPRILKPEDVAELSEGTGVEVFYAMADATGTYASGVWRIVEGEKEQLA